MARTLKSRAQNLETPPKRERSDDQEPQVRKGEGVGKEMEVGSKRWGEGGGGREVGRGGGGRVGEELEVEEMEVMMLTGSNFVGKGHLILKKMRHFFSKNLI